MSGAKPRLAFFAVLFVGIAALYAPAFDYGPNLDDLEQIRLVEHRGGVGALDAFFQFRPIKNLFFHACRSGFGDDYRLWRLVALAIFLVNLVIVDRYLERLTGSRGRAMAGTAVYGLLAVHSAVVVWLSAVPIVVSAACVVLALHWADGGDRSRPRYVASAVALAVALGSYEGAVVFPALLALQAWYLRRSYRDRPASIYLGAVATLLAAYVAARFGFQARIGAGVENLAWPGGQAWWLTFNSARYVALHLDYLLDPWHTFGVRVPDLPAEHAIAAATAWAALGAATLGAALALWRRRSLGAFGFLFFLVGIAPLSNLIPVGSGPVADYYLLLPSLGVVVAGIAWVGALQARIPSRSGRIVPVALVALWVVANVASTVVQRVPAWETPATLLAHARDVQGDSFYHRFVSARIAAGQGNYADAARGYAAALEDAPYHEPSQAGYVVALLNTRNVAAAEAALDGSSPSSDEIREILKTCRAFALEARSRNDEAATLYREIVMNESAPAEAKVTSLVRLTYMNKKWGIDLDVPYSLEQAPADVRTLYLFPGFHQPTRQTPPHGR